jgi:hypothetical protein
MVLLVPLALASGCGGDSGSEAADPAGTSSSQTEPSQTEPTAEATDSAPTTPPWPACEEVWVEGAKLPGAYRGCLESDQPVEADNLSCSSGQRIVRYADRFYGVPGGTIKQTDGPLDKDKGYLKSVRVCRA